MTSISIDRCCVAEAVEPVLFLDVVNEIDKPSQIRRTIVLKDVDLTNFLNQPEEQNYSCRFISICQRNSWRPLQITEPNLALVLSHHGFSPAVHNIISCFYNRNEHIEDSYCVPFSLTEDYPWTEIQYSVRYPEYKKTEERWVIRQTAVCHRINTQTKQTVILLLNPMPQSKAHDLLDQYLTLNAAASFPIMSIHNIFFQAHLPAWRQYNTTNESQFLPVSNSTFSTYIDEPLSVGYKQLSTLANLEAKVLKTCSLLDSTSELIMELKLCISNHPELIENSSQASLLLNALDNHRRQCRADMKVAAFLDKRVQSTSVLLAQTLSFRDQVISKQQNANMLQLNKSAVFITTLLFIYTPASFVATFFGMNFFAMDQPNGTIICTSMIWIYIITTAALTSTTVFFYYWLVRHDNVLFWRLAPKVQVTANLQALVRKMTRFDEAVELGHVRRP